MDPSSLSGHLVAIMAPSGSGKSILIRYLRETLPRLKFAVSCTTREPRPDEKEGETYYFVSQAVFEQKIRDGAFLEWAEFSGNRYGTLVSEIVKPMKEGRVVVREAELQGILAIREIIPSPNRTIVYIDAGPWDVLEKRIVSRAPISPEHLALRRERYVEELKWRNFADVIIENVPGRLEETKEALRVFVAGVLERITKT